MAGYVHANKEVASLVLLRSETDFVSKNEEFMNLAREIALQVAATNPQYVRREDIPVEQMENIKGLFIKEVDGKPDNLKETILAGKVDAYLKGIVLIEQEYIKDSEKTIRGLLEAAVQKFGERIDIEKFTRFSTK